ncbi:MAG TPA: hypothetical protein PK867_05390, partial [Pirellulales bacterium]|nr:hypothetical protein [Pirellulales bacterium]
CAASARLTFASDNRSTALRMVMVVQQALLIGWFGWGFLQEQADPDIGMVYFIVSGIHWAAMGVLINGELGEMSLRVKRQLPQSLLGRAFLTWFNPGPATGYMFIVANLLAATAVGGAFLWGDYLFRGGGAGVRGISVPRSVVMAFGLLELCYIVFYLGLARLVIGLLRRVTPVTLTLAVLLQVLLVMAGSGIPVSIHLMTPSIRSGYSLIEISNPFFSLTEVLQAGDFNADVVVLLIVVPVAAALVFLANVPAIVAAVHQVRIAKPKRVAEEDAELEALRAPPPGPSNPFEDD